MPKANTTTSGSTQRNEGDFYRKRRRVVTPVGNDGMTEQSHKAACDINNIMARYTRTGVMEHVREFEPVYSEQTPDDYHTSMNVVADAKTMFEELPSKMRRHFGDDVSAFLEFCATAKEPAAELQDLAEEYRKQALGIPPSGQPEPEPKATPEKAETAEGTPPE